MVVPSSVKIKQSEKVDHKIYQVPYKSEFFEYGLARLEIEGSKLNLVLKVGEIQITMCERFLQSTELQEKLKGVDMIVYDSLATCPATMLGERFEIPRVEILPLPLTAPLSFNHMVPMPVSYVPQLFTGFSDKMNFVERVMNLGAYFGGKLFMYLMHYRHMNALKVKYNINPERSIQEAVGKAELLISTADFALEYAQPLLPGRKKGSQEGGDRGTLSERWKRYLFKMTNYELLVMYFLVLYSTGNVMVGPPHVKDPKPLPPDLEEFLSNSGGHGFVIVSFGSNVASNLDKPVVDTLATAFGKLKQRVVWRLKGNGGVKHRK